MRPGARVILPAYVFAEAALSAKIDVRGKVTMGFTGFVMAMVGLVFVGISFIPFLGWLNWFVAPFALLTLIVSSAGTRRIPGRLFGILGIVLSLVIIPVSMVRLIIALGAC
jgi:hypothetical protein